VNENFIRGVSIDWDRIAPDSYLRQIEAIRNLDQLEFKKPVTFLVGENGTGKSTLLEAVAVAAGFNPEGGTKNYSFSTYDSHSELCDVISLERGMKREKWGYFLRAETFYNVATAEMEYMEGRSQRFHEKSHGEGFLSLMQNQFQPDSLYLFDEPEAALSAQRQLTMLAEIDAWAKEGSQFIIATHSPILLGVPGAEILSFDEGEIHPVSYEDTDSVQITKLFLEDRERMLKMLLEE